MAAVQRGRGQAFSEALTGHGAALGRYTSPSDVPRGGGVDGAVAVYISARPVPGGFTAYRGTVLSLC